MSQPPNPTNMTRQGSGASKPDLDWSQVRETINMLTLAVAQIEMTMTDGDESVNSLSESFMGIASRIGDMLEKFRQSAASQQQDSDLAMAQQQAMELQTMVNRAIVSFQFYDRLSQRLDHVKCDLAGLSELISNSSQLYNPQAWQTLQTEIMQNYSMEEERLMFQHIMRGASVEEALDIYRHHFRKERDAGDSTDDTIELF